jgi:hypothetical protein
VIAQLPVFAKTAALQAICDSSQVRLNKCRAGMHINLPEHRVTGIDEAMWCLRRNYDDAARFHFALFVSDRDGGGAFEGECDFDVGMHMQRRALSGFGLDDVGRERRALIPANELMRHSNEWQFLETDKAHMGES